MSYKVKILPTAWEDLKRIEDWYYMQFNLETALKVTDNILIHESMEGFFSSVDFL